MQLIDPRNISAKRYKDACDDFECGWNACINEIMECVQQIEAEPVRHGRWREINVPKKWGGSTLRCSECNTGGTKAWTFCPNCGAKMNGCEE